MQIVLVADPLPLEKILVPDGSPDNIVERQTHVLGRGRQRTAAPVHLKLFSTRGFANETKTTTLGRPVTCLSWGWETLAGRPLRRLLCKPGVRWGGKGGTTAPGNPRGKGKHSYQVGRRRMPGARGLPNRNGYLVSLRAAPWVAKQTSDPVFPETGVGGGWGYYPFLGPPSSRPGGSLHLGVRLAPACPRTCCPFRGHVEAQDPEIQPRT